MPPPPVHPPRRARHVPGREIEERADPDAEVLHLARASVRAVGLRPVLEDTVFSPTARYPFNPSDFISVLVWDRFEPEEEPITWFGTHRRADARATEIYQGTSEAQRMIIAGQILAQEAGER